MSERTGWVSQYENDPGDDSGGSPRPPIWVVIVVVVSVVAGGWILVSQESKEADPVTSPTLLPVTPDEISVGTTTTTSVVTTTASTVAGDPVSVFGNPPASITAETPQQLRGYVAVTSPDESSSQDTVWVFRPGGSVVSRADNVIPTNASYPMLITAGHLIVSNQIFDIDLAEPPISLWTDESVYPGSDPGVVWIARRPSGSRISAYDWVSLVDVESLTVGEQVDLIPDVFFFPLVGVADGLIVAEFSDESMVFWSPTDGFADARLTDDIDAVFAASGNVVVVVVSGSVNVHDSAGELVSSFELPEVLRRVTSACLSPDGQQVIIVDLNGEAVVAHITHREFIDLNAVNDEFPIQPKHGIGWTTDDQLVFIGEGEFGKKVLGFDVATDERFDVATLDGSDRWWLAASGTMC